MVWWRWWSGHWDFEEALRSAFSRDALDQSGRALPKIYLSPERKSSNRSRFDRIITPSVSSPTHSAKSRSLPAGASRPLAFGPFRYHNTAYIRATYVHLTDHLPQTPSIPSFLISARAGPPFLPGRSSSFTIGSASKPCACSRTFRPKLPRKFKL